jgi:hypothetical protein
MPSIRRHTIAKELYELGQKLEARAALPREEPTKPDLQAIAPDEMED